MDSVLTPQPGQQAYEQTPTVMDFIFPLRDGYARLLRTPKGVNTPYDSLCHLVPGGACFDAPAHLYEAQIANGEFVSFDPTEMTERIIRIHLAPYHRFLLWLADAAERSTC